MGHLYAQTTTGDDYTQYQLCNGLGIQSSIPSNSMSEDMHRQKFLARMHTCPGRFLVTPRVNTIYNLLNDQQAALRA